MAKRVFSVQSYTPTAVADTTNLTNLAYQAIAASGAAAGLLVSEIFIGGQATASTVNDFVFARDTIVGATPTALPAGSNDGPMNSLTAALSAVPITYTGATTLPQRTSATTAARLNLSMNAFGGIIRWVAYPGEEWGIIGVTVNISESTLSCMTAGGGLTGSHLVYEPY